MQAPALRRKYRSDSYRKVLDSRKRRVRGMWQRNDRYYANLTVSDDVGRKASRFVPLQGATLEDAKADYNRLLTERMDDRLRPMGLTPFVSDYITVYCEQLAVSGKRPSTVAKVTAQLGVWSKKIGHLRLNKIRALHLSKALTELSKEGYAGRTVNLFLIAIRGLLKAALRDGYIKPPLPFEGIAWQKVDQKARPLYTSAELDQLCDAALVVSKNGRQFVDYIRFLQYSGARRNEALRVRWEDLDFKRGHVTIGAEGDSKNREARHVDLNGKLEAHLKEMEKRRQPDSKWLFPSPQRGDKDASTKTFMETLRLARAATGFVCGDCQRLSIGEELRCCAHCKSEQIQRKKHVMSEKLRKIGFHDTRHHFISQAVMAGLDFVTVARWVGHKDGGVLIGRVYSHLADSHRKAQAAKLSFTSA